jgi:adenylate cyclase
MFKMKTFLKFTAVGILSGVAAFLLSFVPIAELIELKCYDLLHYFKAAGEAPAEIVVVAIDEQSFDYFKKQWPWPRGVHAKLLKNLREQGASVIAFDIVFAENSVDREDQEFFRELSSTRNVVLASEYEEVADRQYDMSSVIRPLPLFMKVSQTGIISVPVDRDGVIRKIPIMKPGDISFASMIAELYSAGKVVIPEGRYISYIGPARSIKTISYYQAFDPEYFLPKDFLKGKIVLIGMGVRAAPDPRRADLFPTPYSFTFFRQPLMPGVEIHANVVNDILKGRYVRGMDKLMGLLLFLGIGLIGSLSQAGWKPVRGFLIALSLTLLYLGAVVFLFTSHRYWMPAFLPVIALVLPYAIFGTDAYIHSEKKRREIRKAFSYYVSPKVLDLILVTPEMLTLGGKKEVVTVMFADIANFTPMAEALSPEDLVKILNRFFTEMTNIIFEYNGLVDKFIGDAIMAVWGCPVKDEEHALKATLASVAMMKRMETFRADLKAEGGPEIHIRIGLSSGEAIAGNMGSSERFDYTVIGDTVNLAARLQDANKGLGTSILIDESVFKRIEGKTDGRGRDEKIDLVPRGKITVKGKSKEINVYEVKYREGESV